MGRNTEINEFFKRLQIGLTTLGVAGGVTLGAGCSNANTESTKQSIPYTESIENLDQQLEEANRKILVDYSLFSNHESFSKLTIQGKANATVQVDKDMDEWMRIQIAKAVTESTHQACSLEDVWTFCSVGNPGFTWDGAEIVYTNRERIRAEKTIESPTIRDILDNMAFTKKLKYSVNTDGKMLITEDLTQGNLDIMTKKYYNMALQHIIKFIENGCKVVFDEENFRIEKENDLSDEYKQFGHQQLNIDSDVEKAIESFNVEYREEEQSLEQLDRQLKEYADIFKTGPVYTAMTIKQKNELHRNAERDMCKILRIKIADAITKGTGMQCIPEDVVIFRTSDGDLYGFTWRGAKKAITIKERGDDNSQIAPEIKKILKIVRTFSMTTRYDNKNGMTDAPLWMGSNEDTTHSHGKKYGEGRARNIEGFQEKMNNINLCYDGKNFTVELLSKDNNSQEEEKHACTQDSKDLTH